MRHLPLRKKLSLNEKQVDRLANIFDNAGQVMLGIAVLSPLIAGFDKHDLIVILSGIVAVLVCWTTSILITKKGRN